MLGQPEVDGPAVVGGGDGSSEVGVGEGAQAEVSDPYGSDLASYRATYAELQELIATVVSRVAGPVR